MINCAGPFATTAAPVIEAALRAGIPYVDVAAEIEANVDTFTHFTDRARAAGAVIVPAMAFYGGLGDLLTTAAMGDWTAADEAHIAYGLSSSSTSGAGRGTGPRFGGQRRVQALLNQEQQVAAVSRAPGNLDLFVLGADNHIWSDRSREHRRARVVIGSPRRGASR